MLLSFLACSLRCFDERLGPLRTDGAQLLLGQIGDVQLGRRVHLLIRERRPVGRFDVNVIRHLRCRELQR